MIKKAQILTAMIYVISLSACTTSIILPPISSEKTYQLAQGNKQISLTVKTPCQYHCTLGSQNALFLPLGKTVAEDLYSIVFNTVYESLVLKGFHPTTQTKDTATLPHIEINFDHITVNTSDRFIDRRVTTSIFGHMTLTSQRGTTKTFQINHNRQTRYSAPFSEEVTFELIETIKEAIPEIHSF